MIRFLSILAILLTSLTLFAFDGATPLSSFAGRYSVDWWTCSSPTKGGLGLMNQIVIYDKTIVLAGCSGGFDRACETKVYESQLLMQNMRSDVNGFSGTANEPMFNYEIWFHWPDQRGKPEIIIRMQAEFGGEYDVTCRSDLNPIF